MRLVAEFDVECLASLGVRGEIEEIVPADHPFERLADRLVGPLLVLYESV